MLNFVNGINYFLNAKFYWGSDSKDVESNIDNNINGAELIPENIRKLDIYSSLSYPFFHGSIVYDDNRRNSALRNMVDMPIVYGQIHFSMVNGSDAPGSDNVPEPEEGENFEEEVFVTGIDTIDDGVSEYVKLKINFVSIDYLKFVSNLKEISTFEDFDKRTKPLQDLVSEMFGAVGLGDKLDKDSITVNVEVPYISTENDTLLTALDYVYRKIFDYDFKEHDGKTYCRIVYDHNKKKYVLWKFEDVGTKDAVDTKLKNLFVKQLREMVSVDALVGTGKSGRNARAYVKNSGSQSILFETLDNIKFTDYDYVKNEFMDSTKEKNGDSFIEHDDEFDSETGSKSKLVFGNSRLFKDLFYERTFSTSRQNGSYYDVFSEAIFDSSFMRVESNGSIGRRAGNSIVLTFFDPEKTVYEQLNGDYLITAINNHYENDGKNKSFRSIMDLYRPYCTVDSIKKKMIT